MKRLKCEDCGLIFGCIQPLRWGENPHFCGLCNQNQLCNFKTSRAAVNESTEYRCPNCTSKQKQQYLADLKREQEEEECSEYFHRLAYKDMPA